MVTNLSLALVPSAPTESLGFATWGPVFSPVSLHLRLVHALSSTRCHGYGEREEENLCLSNTV